MAGMRPLLCLTLFLAACNTGSPTFWGVDPISREVDGSKFLIRLDGDKAEVIRTNPEWLPDPDETATKAAFAVQTLTGCEAAWVAGDAAKMLIGLSCNGAAPPPKPGSVKGYTCTVRDLDQFGSYSEMALDCIIQKVTY